MVCYPSIIEKCANNFDCIYDPCTKEGKSSLCFISSVGIWPRTQTTRKMHAGALIFVQSTMEQNAHQYYRSLFSVQARPKNSFVKWATRRNPTATAFPTMIWWTCSILSPPPTSCECCHFFSLFLIIDLGLFRKCDSRNLNLNPLCMLRAGAVPALWTEKVIKDHIKTFAILILGERDLQDLWQLTPPLHLNLVQPDEENTQGPAACHWVNGKTLSCKFFDVYFNRGWVLQRLGGGHCCCQHLLWQGHRYGWEGSLW